MTIPDFFDLAVHHLHHFRADCLDLSASFTGAREARFGYAAAAVAGTNAQFAMRIAELREFRLVRTAHFRDSDHALAIRSDQHGLVMEARHDAFEVVPVECVEI